MTEFRNEAFANLAAATAAADEMEAADEAKMLASATSAELTKKADDLELWSFIVTDPDETAENSARIAMLRELAATRA